MGLAMLRASASGMPGRTPIAHASSDTAITAGPVRAAGKIVRTNFSSVSSILTRRRRLVAGEVLAGCAAVQTASGEWTVCVAD